MVSQDPPFFTQSATPGSPVLCQDPPWIPSGSPPGSLYFLHGRHPLDPPLCDKLYFRSPADSHLDPRKAGRNCMCKKQICASQCVSVHGAHGAHKSPYHGSARATLVRSVGRQCRSRGRWGGRPLMLHAFSFALESVEEGYTGMNPQCDKRPPLRSCIGGLPSPTRPPPK